MKNIHTLVAAVCCALVTIFVLGACTTQEAPLDQASSRDPALEQEILDRLAAIDPDAVPIFQAATEAMDGDDPIQAKQDYERVLALAPDFPDALRRLSYVELDLGNIDTALELASRANVVGDSPHNLVALARVLLATEVAANESAALSLALEAVEALPDDDFANETLLFAGLANEDMTAIRQATETLLEVIPDYPLAHYFAGLLAAEDGKWERAERELLLAQELGMPRDLVQQVLDDDIASQARLFRTIRWAGYAVGIWLVGLAALLLIGMLLSRLTLLAVERHPASARFEVGREERLVRAFYRAIIVLASVYFYFSIPFVIFFVVALAAGVFYLFFTAGRIPLYLAAATLGLVVYTLVAVVRGIFAQMKQEEPGRALTPEEAPDLWSLARSVAERVTTRPVDAIYVIPGTAISVMERGSILRKLSGRGQRCLVLGLGALPGMTQAQFQAILAHEYGHFSGQDTAGGNLARQVHVAMDRMAYTLAVNGQARWHNPAWLFLNGYNRIFLRITLGASRLQEILADRYAAAAFGAQNLIDGVSHIIYQDQAFRASVNHAAETASHLKAGLPNLYALTALPGAIKERLDKSVEEVMTRPTLPFDSHPAPKERFRLLRQLESVGETAGGEAPVWSLLADAEALQGEMMIDIQRSVRRWQRERALRA